MTAQYQERGGFRCLGSGCRETTDGGMKYEFTKAHNRCKIDLDKKHPMNHQKIIYIAPVFASHLATIKRTQAAVLPEPATHIISI